MNLSSPAVVGSLLRRHHLIPDHRFGQNFLVDQNTLVKIADAAYLAPGDSVLEIGSGLGVLTSELANRVTAEGRVVTVEIDRRLLPALAETIGELPQVRLLSQDALALQLDQLSLEGLSIPFAVVANIPYQITSPLIALFLERKQFISTIVLLVQQEVAQRLAAAPSTSDYGAFSVFAQFHTKVEIVGTVSKNCFFPSPKVTSAIVRLTPHAVAQVQVADEALFFRIVRASFGQRRKTLANALANDPHLGWPKEFVLARLTDAGISPERRGETLSIAEFAEIARA